MSLYTFTIILGIGFWVLFALMVVGMFAYIYTQIQYYRWAKQDRDEIDLAKLVTQAVVETLDEIDAREWGEESDEEKDLGGGN